MHKLEIYESLRYLVVQVVDYGKIELGTESSKRLINLFNTLKKELEEEGYELE